MKKLMITLILVVMSVVNVSAKNLATCMVVRNNGSTVTVTFNMVEYYDIDSECVPYAQYLRPHTYFLAEVWRNMWERFQYNMQYYSPLEAGQQFAIEKAKYARLKVIVANLGRQDANGAKVDTVSREQVKKDAHKAAQDYSKRRAAENQKEIRITTKKADSTQTNYRTEGNSGFASGL